MPTTQPYHSGQIYDPNVPTLVNEQLKYLDVLYDFNMTRPSEMPKRQALLAQMLAEVGENCCIEPPFRANWRGQRCH